MSKSSAALILGDIREYVFPLFTKSNDGSGIQAKFLGSAFFISQNGIALTAAHCIPAPHQLRDGERLVAGLRQPDMPIEDRTVKLMSVVASTMFPKIDISVIKVKATPVKYLPLSFEPVLMGQDLMSVGIPEHSVNGEGKEFRCLKGHVTFVSKLLELSFPVPMGMSGSPVMLDGQVVAVLVGNARSETLEDVLEEKTETLGGQTKISRIEARTVVNYGKAEPIAWLKDWRHEITGDKPFAEFVSSLNSTSAK